VKEDRNIESYLAALILASSLTISPAGEEILYVSATVSRPTLDCRRKVPRDGFRIPYHIQSNDNHGG
jgi:hypothetical protein